MQLEISTVRKLYLDVRRFCIEYALALNISVEGIHTLNTIKGTARLTVAIEATFRKRGNGVSDMP